MRSLGQRDPLVRKLFGEGADADVQWSVKVESKTVGIVASENWGRGWAYVHRLCGGTGAHQLANWKGAWA